MATNFSTRAEILRRVLRHLNDGSYVDSGEQIWFGDGLGAPLPSECLDDKEKLLKELGRDASNYLARLEAIERTSLDQEHDPSIVSPLLQKFLDDLTAEQRKTRAGEFARTASAVRPADSFDKEITESLDSHYASEVIEKLEDIVCRVSRLGKISTSIIPNKKVQLVFEEAHRCYLYGFHLACAVFCRAILEASLKETIHPDKDTTRSIYAMVEVAEERRALTDDRPLCARAVDKAGNLAIHEPDKFDQRYSAEYIAEILINTRKVLEELYQ